MLKSTFTQVLQPPLNPAVGDQVPLAVEGIALKYTHPQADTHTNIIKNNKKKIKTMNSVIFFLSLYIFLLCYV